MINMKKRNQTKRDRTDLTIDLLELLRVAVIAIVVALMFFMLIARKKEVVGNSMYPLLEDKESVFINVAASYLTSIERFDVVVVEHEESNELWVKRVIGLPKESVSYRDGKLYINDQMVEEPFLDKEYQTKDMKELGLSVFTQDMDTVTLGENEYFVVGDNRNHSLDSRNPSIGAFQRSQIKAKGVLVYAPLSKVRYVSGGTTGTEN